MGGVSDAVRSVGRAIDPTTGRGLANLATGGMYEMNSQLGGNGKGGGKGGGAPEAPDFTAAANEQTRANRPTQNNPFSSSQWTQDANGNWTQNVSLTPGLNDAVSNLTNTISQGSSLDPAAARDQAINAAYGQATSRLDPQWTQRGAALETSLANKGLTPGSEAFRNAMGEYNNSRNDAYSQAMYNAQTGAGNAAFGQSMAANNQPYQQLGALQGLTQQNSFAPSANLLGALGQQYAGQLNSYGIDQANKNSMLSGIGSLGGAAIMASDERLKDNVERLPFDAIPGVPFATWEWKHRPGDRQLGVIAQDLQKVRPELVVTGPDGTLMVDYGKLWEVRRHG